MPLARRRRRSRSVVVALAVVAVVVGLAPAAEADDPPTAGDVVVGELVQAWPEHRDPAEAAEHGDDGPLSWITTGAGDTVRVPTEDVDHLPVGDTVEVTVGRKVRDEASREDGLAPAREVVDSAVVAPAEATPPGTAPAGPPYTDDVTAVLVSPPGTTHDSTTVSQLVATLNGPVADFWEGQSGGLVKIHGIAGPSSWIDTTHGCDDPVAVWNEVASNPLVRFSRTSGKHLMLYIPGYDAGDAPDCAYGLAQVGPTTRTYGGFLYVRADDVAVMAHELGHNFGLGHSSEVQCDRALDTGTCRTWSYADYYDVMGYSWDEVGSLNVVQAARIGLLPAGQRQAVTTATPPATYTLAPVSGRSGTRALTLTAADGTVYWLEYRPAAGQDAWLGTAADWPGLQAGVLLRRAGSSSDTSLLLDATPSPSSSWDTDSLQVLPVGTSLTLGGGSFVVTVQSTGPGGAIVQLGSPITAEYAALGGAGGVLGAATTSVICGLRSAGCYQGFGGGAIYWSPGTGAHVVTGPVAARWAASGWEAGAMGYPVTDTVCGLSDSGCFQHFESASVFSSATGGTHAVWGAIRGWWWAHGSETGTAGYPTTEEICGLRAGGCYQGFTKGTVYWSPGTGAHVVTGPVAARWAAQGWEAGPMGYPVSDPTCGLSDGGCYQVFQVGSIYSSASTGVHAVWGAILQRWGAQGWETGPAGYPTSDESCDASGCRQQFRGAVISWSPTAGTLIGSR